MKNGGEVFSDRKIGINQPVRVEKPVGGESIIRQAEIRKGHFPCLVFEIQSLRKSCFESGGRVLGKLFRICVASQRDVKRMHVLHFFVFLVRNVFFLSLSEVKGQDGVSSAKHHQLSIGFSHLHLDHVNDQIAHGNVMDVSWFKVGNSFAFPLKLDFS